MRTPLTPWVLGTMLMACGSAVAQHALDKPLDKNLQVGAGGVRNPARPSINEELRLRNAIVTGNAPGGFSFRGDVGYRAPGEFFGSLGSNETFSFRRDSFYSGLAGLGIRGTDALQYQFAMTTGNTPPPGFAGTPGLIRSGTSATSGVGGVRAGNAIGAGGGITRAATDLSDPGADVRGMSLMSLRSPAAFMASRGLEPTLVGRQALADGSVVGMAASSLRGITFDTVQPPREQDQPRPGAVPPVSERLGDAPGAKPDTKTDSKLDTSTTAGQSAYDDLMDRIKAGGDKAKGAEAAADPGKAAVSQRWQTQLEELRKHLGATAAPKRPGEPARPGAARPADPKPGEGADKAEQPSGAIDRIRDAGAKVAKLTLPGYDPFSAHMQAAQEYIATSQFFFAEERFTAALAIKSGDPMAAIGRVHAQLGAAMFLSAAINLRSLFTEHPEVVSLKYQPELLPSKERLKMLVERLTELTIANDGRRRDTAFLLAYVGFQSGDDPAMKQGLEIMAEPPETVPGEKPPEGPDQLQRLASLLSKIWLTPPPPKPEAPAPPEPGK